MLKDQSDPEVINFFLCSTQLGMKISIGCYFFQLINATMHTIVIVGILTVMSWKIAFYAYLHAQLSKA